MTTIARRAAFIAVTASIALMGTNAYAADRLRVGKDAQQNFGNLPLELAIKTAIFTSRPGEGLDE